MKRKPKHNIFISYYHKEAQEYKDALAQTNIQSLYDDSLESVFGQDRSVKQNSIKDEGLTSQQIRKIIRKDYIRDAEVLILLCSENVRKRKHVDWEIHAAMSNSNNEKQLGILVINLPNVNNGARLLSNKEETRVLGLKNKIRSESIDNEYIENNFPKLPNRIKENILRDNVNISIINWSDIYGKPKKLMYFIDNAFKNGKTNKYNNKTALKRNNS